MAKSTQNQVIGLNDQESKSEKIKAALQARRARGLPLGAENRACRNLTAEARKKGGQTTQQRCFQRYRVVIAFICQLRDDGKSYSTIAHELNAGGYTTVRGMQWQAMQVYRLLKRLKELGGRLTVPAGFGKTGRQQAPS